MNALQHFEARPFQLAATADAQILRRVQQAIADSLDPNENTVDLPQEKIEEILTAAGVHKSGPAYCELVQRTNMMASYNAAAEEQRTDPDVIASFPVWRWDAIMDGRERPRHGDVLPGA
jgi:hypothetical protein